MRNDMPQAALRLMSSLPVRTHERAPNAYVAVSKPTNSAQEVSIDGVIYESLTAAAIALGCARETLRRAIREGKSVSLYREHMKRPNNGGTNRKELIVGTRRFRSVNAAIQALRVGHRTISAMLADGRARYAGRHDV